MAKIKCLQAGEHIPAGDHVLRYCRPNHYQDGKITLSAFALRKAEEYLSVNWLEYFNDNRNIDQCVESIRNAIILTIPKNSKFVKISVLKIRELSQYLQVKYHPTEDPSHAGIHVDEKDRADKDRDYAHWLASLANLHQTSKSNHKG